MPEDQREGLESPDLAAQLRQNRDKRANSEAVLEGIPETRRPYQSRSMG